MAWTDILNDTSAWISDSIFNFLLLETGDYLLQEDMNKVLLESSINANYTDTGEPTTIWT